ncbi:Soluble cytochrome b558 [Dermatophilus congolensis]|uniref:Soluble cytochrome b558 n=1 Tax=Dermatophilus congolensis TaxID=1863 RepID=A0AA46BMI9_9MICO|nr:cytochrome b5-like heme/steroid binding domain-containing protein [Dermatophilus congolensis]STD07003.1 Soluble cytochrome b558 [Dermatophilus congolensis]
MQSSGPFDLIGELPVHALTLHATVVLLPLALIALVAVIFTKRIQPRLRTPITIVVMLVGLLTLVTKESGEALEHRIGDPGVHAEYADILTLVTGLTVLATMLWWLLGFFAARKTHQADSPEPLHTEESTAEPHRKTPSASPMLSIASQMLSLLIAVLSVATLILVVMVGHTGATATWKDQISNTTPTSGLQGEDSTTSSTAPSSTSTPTGPSGHLSPSPTRGATPTPTGTRRPITMAQVKQHSTSSSCWVSINNKVYDLTAWISRHPGGPGRIKSLCGTDATAKFSEKHGQERDPNQVLAKYLIGALVTEHQFPPRVR